MVFSNGHRGPLLRQSASPDTAHVYSTGGTPGNFFFPVSHIWDTRQYWVNIRDQCSVVIICYFFHILIKVSFDNHKAIVKRTVPGGGGILGQSGRK